jgi:hypothetical protein
MKIKKPVSKTAATAVKEEVKETKTAIRRTKIEEPEPVKEVPEEVSEEMKKEVDEILGVEETPETEDMTEEDVNIPDVSEDIPDEIPEDTETVEREENETPEAALSGIYGKIVGTLTPAEAHTFNKYIIETIDTARRTDVKEDIEKYREILSNNEELMALAEWMKASNVKLTGNALKRAQTMMEANKTDLNAGMKAADEAENAIVKKYLGI